jgi:hypothetical protein
MSELNLHARELLSHAYLALRPSSSDRARVASALAARLGAAAFAVPEPEAAKP